MEILRQALADIKPSNEEAKKLVREKWDGKVKPIGSLGTLEEVTIKIAGMTGKVENSIDKKAIVVMASDNGVVGEGVSSSPQIFTRLLAESMSRGQTGVATLGKFGNIDIKIIDIGLNGELNIPEVMNKKIANGTKSFLRGPAMTYDEAVRAIETGIEIGDEMFKEGYDILGTGELGIGNTTTSAAVLKVFADYDIEAISGKGAGLTNEQLQHKIQVILRGIEFNKPDKDDPIDVLAKVGGFDIGGMCGLYLSAAKNRKPIVVDGYISAAAALRAVKLAPAVRDFLIPSHLSDEPGAKYVMNELSLKPMVYMNMRLGEGTGCPFAFMIIEAALYTLENMGTFEDAQVDSKVLINIREDN